MSWSSKWGLQLSVILVMEYFVDYLILEKLLKNVTRFVLNPKRFSFTVTGGKKQENIHVWEAKCVKNCLIDNQNSWW